MQEAEQNAEPDICGHLALSQNNKNKKKMSYTLPYTETGHGNEKKKKKEYESAANKTFRYVDKKRS